MKKFVKLIQQVHTERFSVVMEKILSKKIPVAFFSPSFGAQYFETVKNFREQGLNITNLFVTNSATPQDDLDFNVFDLKDAARVYPQPEYILTVDFIDARVAIKNFPASK